VPAYGKEKGERRKEKLTKRIKLGGAKADK